MSNMSSEVSMNSEKKKQFGDRKLTDANCVFEHNAWDNVEWNEEQQLLAQEKVSENSVITLSEEALKEFHINAVEKWNKFYGIHQNKFFKDRHWLFTEFPELAPSIKGDDSEISETVPSKSRLEKIKNTRDELNDCQEKQKIFEIGCGVGNTIFPILMYNSNPNLVVYGCDFSSTAIEILKLNPDYDETRCKVFVLDATTENWEPPFREETLDIALLIFVLSSIVPDKYVYI
ncbi:methyltransferase-like protein 2-A [Fopius arisanus]|uniref:Methyltransferase-like protein 2-A n=1 Tax=Fopius arisanus TaxID=64838 RepID=A0A9R1TNX5_9HYME|nr:PREDICTED: methyltransferase-like protein 2-A [Fopius arisanus]